MYAAAARRLRAIPETPRKGANCTACRTGKERARVADVGAVRDRSPHPTLATKPFSRA